MEVSRPESIKDNSYHNSIAVHDNVTLNMRESKCRKQEEVILKFFKLNPGKDFTPYEVWIHTGKLWPKSSVQRAITNLCQKREKLAVTGTKRKGEFDVETNCWILKTV